MNSQEFLARLTYICETLFASGFLKNLKDHNFSGSELAQIQVSIAQLATQTALNLQELDLKKQQAALEMEKIRQDIELNIATNRLQNIKIASDAVTSAVQAESIKRSVVDNAAINKANAFVQHFNVSMNAVQNNPTNLAEGGSLKNISDLVIRMIEKIDDKPLDANFDNVIKELLERALNLKDLGLGNKQVAIIAPKTILAPDEPVTLFGISTFGDNDCEFIIGSGEAEIVESSKFYVFRAEKVGRYKITFRARDNAGAWKSASVSLRVAKVKEPAKLPCTKPAMLPPVKMPPAKIPAKATAKKPTTEKRS